MSEVIEFGRGWNDDSDLQETTPERRPGITDKSKLPDDLPRIHGAQSEAFSISDNHVTAWQHVTLSPDSAYDSLKSKLAEDGWQLSVTQDLPDGRQTVWKKGNRVCRIDCYSQNSGTEIWIRCDTVQ